MLGNHAPRQIHELSARVGVAPPEPAPWWPDIVVPQAAMSRRSVPRDSRHAVEIRINTGKIGKSILVFDTLEEFGGGRTVRAFGSKWWMNTPASRKTVAPAGKSA